MHSSNSMHSVRRKYRLFVGRAVLSFIPGRLAVKVQVNFAFRRIINCLTFHKYKEKQNTYHVRIDWKVKRPNHDLSIFQITCQCRLFNSEISRNWCPVSSLIRKYGVLCQAKNKKIKWRFIWRGKPLFTWAWIENDPLDLHFKDDKHDTRSLVITDLASNGKLLREQQPVSNDNCWRTNQILLNDGKNSRQTTLFSL